MDRIEYIAIQVGSGAVCSISPESPQTKSAYDPTQSGNHDIGSVVSKLSEYEYRLVDGVVPTGEVHPGGANYILFMQRTVLP